MDQNLTCAKNTQQGDHWTQKTKECQEKLRNLKTRRIDDVARFVLHWLTKDPPDFKGYTLSLIIGDILALHEELPREELITTLHDLFWNAGENVIKQIQATRRKEDKIVELWETIAMAES